jgi:hypothetical protein
MAIDGEQPVLCAVHPETNPLRSLGYTLASLASSDQFQRMGSPLTILSKKTPSIPTYSSQRAASRLHRKRAVRVY